MDVPFNILKKDVPVELARYVRNFVVEQDRRKGYYNGWALEILKNHTRAIHCLYWLFATDVIHRSHCTWRAKKNREGPKAKMSKNTRKGKIGSKIFFDMKYHKTKNKL